MENLAPELASVFNIVATGNKEEVEKAVNNYKDPYGIQRNLYDTRDCHLYMLTQKKDGAGRGLLHYACMYNTDDVASWLASLSPQNVSGTPAQFSRDGDRNGVTAAMFAAKAGFRTVISQLTQPLYNPYQSQTAMENFKNRIVQAIDNQGRTLLHYCFGEGEPVPTINKSRQKECTPDDRNQMGKFLVEKGINLFQKDKTGQNAIQHAIVKEWNELLNYIIGNHSRALKIWENKEFGIIAMLSEKLIYPRISLFTTPLEISGGYTHLCVRECFIQDAKINRETRLETFESKIQKGKLNVNEVDDNGMTALHYLCYYKFDTEPYGVREGAIAKLLELGADPYIEDIRGYTPLMCAVEKGFVDIHDLSDPRTKNCKGIGNLLNASIKIQNVLSLNTATDSADGDLKALCVNNCSDQIRKMKIRVDTMEDGQNDLREEQRKTVTNLAQCELKCSEKQETSLRMMEEETSGLKQQLKRDLQEIQEICLKKLEKMEQETSALKQKQDRDLQVMTERIINLEDHYENKIKELKTEYEGRFDAIKERNDHLYNTVVELQQDVQAKNQKIELLEDQLNIIKVQNEESARKVTENPSNSLLLSNLVLNDVCRYLDSGAEVSCLPEAKLDELQATVEKDEQKYKTIYLVMAHQGVENIQEIKESWIKLVQASKGKVMSVIVSSFLPTIDDEDVNNKIKQLNKCLEEVCSEQHAQFVNNDITFKHMDGTINDEYFEENSDILSVLGIKRLLKNLGLLKIRKIAKVTNI